MSKIILAAASNTPPAVHATWDFPGASVFITVIDILLTVGILAMMAFFIIGVIKLVGSLSGRSQGGAGGAGVQIFASFIGGAIFATGLNFFNAWVGYFHV